MRFFIPLLLLDQTFGFVRRLSPVNQTSKHVSINPLVYENTLEQKSIGDLLGQVEDTERIFLRSDMRQAYTRKVLNEDGIYDIKDYSVVN